MAECIICDTLQDPSAARLVYEDDIVIAFLHPKPANPGHVVLSTKKHLPIMENIDDNTLSHMFNIASKASSAIFDVLGVQGTNIFVQNGLPAGQKVPHFMIHVIPRSEGDGIDLTWQPKQLSTEEISAVELKIRGVLEGKAPVIKEESPPKKPGVSTETEKEQDTQQENYLLKQLRRMP